MRKTFIYLKTIFLGIWNLLLGMYVTMLNFIRPKVTEQYPENRLTTLVKFERTRGQLLMPHDGENFHKCTACGICQMNCPNGTITITTKMVADETGKERKALDVYMYDIGSCTFCALCTQTCPQDAIEWSNDFEHSVFRRNTLYQKLNQEGSSLKPKPVPAPKPAAAPTTAPATAPAEQTKE